MINGWNLVIGIEIHAQVNQIQNYFLHLLLILDQARILKLA